MKKAENPPAADPLLGETGEPTTGSNITLEGIYDTIESVTDVDWFDKIADKAKDKKRRMTEEEIAEGDIVALSPKCSRTLRVFMGTNLVVEEVDREGRYHVTISGMETLLSRDKILLISKKEV